MPSSFVSKTEKSYLSSAVYVPSRFLSSNSSISVKLSLTLSAAKEGKDIPARTAVRKELKATPLQKCFTPPHEVFF